MPIYLVSCALRGISHNYQPLWSALEKAGAKCALESTWLLEADLDINQITNVLLPFLEPDDSLFVTEIPPGARWSATRLTDESGPWLMERRP